MLFQRSKKSSRSHLHVNRRKTSIEHLEKRYCLSAYFDFSVVAQTGGGTFSSLGTGPSINNLGQIGFKASVFNSQLGQQADNVFGFDTNTNTLTKLMGTQYEQPNSGAAPNQTISDAVEINDQ